MNTLLEACMCERERQREKAAIRNNKNSSEKKGINLTNSKKKKHSLVFNSIADC